MNLHLFVPGLFWPDNSRPEVYQQLQLPALETILTKSRWTETPQQMLEPWLCQAFGVEKQHDWPIAPIQLQSDSQEIKAENSYWLRIDPVFLRIENNHILLADSQIVNISLKEATQLADSINAQFATDGLTILPLLPDRWYLRCDQQPDLRTCLLSEAAGKNINTLMPVGEDSALGNSRINEIQMLLHEHPVNQAREERGELPINSLWLWGGGVLPEMIHTEYSGVWSNQAFARALATTSKTEYYDLPESADQLLRDGEQTGEQLVVLDALQKYVCYRDAYGWRETLSKLEQNWFSVLLQALKDKRIKQLILTVTDSQPAGDFLMTPSHLWKFWLRNRPLSAYRRTE